MTRDPAPFTPERLLDAMHRLPVADTYWVGFSGGADSTALLHALAISPERPGSRLRAIHVNHGLHRQSDDWQAHCEAFCNQFNIELTVRRVTVDKRSGRGPEGEARHQRYSVVGDLLTEGDVFVTAHHLDDQAETLLLNLVRGSGVEGLAGMPAWRPLGRGFLARPLLEFEMISLRAYLLANDLPWIEDPGNVDLSFDRNFVRSRLLPLLEERWPGAAHNLARSAGLCRAAAATITGHAEAALAQHRVHNLVLDLAGLNCTAEDFGFLLRQWLRTNGAPPLPYRRLEELRVQLESAGAGDNVRVAWEGWSIRWYDQRLWLRHGEDPPACPDRNWTGEGVLDLGRGCGTLSLEPPAILPYPVRVRPRAPGDRIQAVGSDAHRKLKDILRELRVPPWLRDSIPVLDNTQQVLAIADRVLCSEISEALSKTDSSLRWRPADPVLQFLAREWRK